MTLCMKCRSVVDLIKACVIKKTRESNTHEQLIKWRLKIVRSAFSSSAEKLNLEVKSC